FPQRGREVVLQSLRRHGERLSRNRQGPKRRGFPALEDGFKLAAGVFVGRRERRRMLRVVRHGGGDLVPRRGSENVVPSLCLLDSLASAMRSVQIACATASGSYWTVGPCREPCSSTRANPAGHRAPDAMLLAGWQSSSVECSEQTGVRVVYGFRNSFAPDRAS